MTSTRASILLGQPTEERFSLGLRGSVWLDGIKSCVLRQGIVARPHHRDCAVEHPVGHAFLFSHLDERSRSLQIVPIVLVVRKSPTRPGGRQVKDLIHARHGLAGYRWVAQISDHGCVQREIVHGGAIRSLNRVSSLYQFPNEEGTDKSGGSRHQNIHWTRNSSLLVVSDEKLVEKLGCVHDDPKREGEPAAQAVVILQDHADPILCGLKPFL